MTVFGRLLCAFAATGAAAVHMRAAVKKYSFAQFVTDYDRDYKVGSTEYSERATIFEASLLEVQAKQARHEQEGRSFSVGIHPFMDWTKDERKVMHGYKPSRARSAGSWSFGQTSARGMSRTNTSARQAVVNANGFAGDSVAIRNQGNCGSCWAISAAEAVEAQLHRNGADPSVKVSAQALVDCTPNPQHCGGKGGCDGATGELAYTFMRDHGIPLEDELAYNGRTNACEGAGVDAGSTPWPTQKRVRVSGWTNLPSNKVEPVKQALLNQGPVVVAVDANDWFDYNQGIYDGCSKDATLVHAVLLKEYGSDGGKNYWRIQNSWGANWGERGHIRLAMHDDEESYCGTDSHPEQGLGCDGGPPSVRVCGECGLLFDPIVPEGATIEDGDSSPSASAATSFNFAPQVFDTSAAAPEVDAPKFDAGVAPQEFAPATSSFSSSDNTPSSDSVEQMKKLMGGDLSLVQK